LAKQPVEGGHKPGILRDFSERGKLGELILCNLGKIVTNKVFLVHHSNISVKLLFTE